MAPTSDTFAEEGSRGEARRLEMRKLEGRKGEEEDGDCLEEVTVLRPALLMTICED